MKTNTLSLSFRQVEATDRSPAHLVAELRVDDEIVGEEHVLDLRCLANALTRDGEHYIFTCGCGDSGCAGIHEGFHSWIDGDIISVEGNLPKGVQCSWKFSAVHAKHAVVKALEDVEPMAESTYCNDSYPIGPYGVEVDVVRSARMLLIA